MTKNICIFSEMGKRRNEFRPFIQRKTEIFVGSSHGQTGGKTLYLKTVKNGTEKRKEPQYGKHFIKKYLQKISQWF